MFELGHDPSTSTPVRGPARGKTQKIPIPITQSNAQKPLSLCVPFAAGGGKTVGDETSVSTAILNFIIQSAFLANSPINR
jgi:hypothetical protein